MDERPGGVEVVPSGAEAGFAEEQLVTGGGMVPKEVGVGAARSTTNAERDAGKGSTT